MGDGMSTGISEAEGVLPDAPAGGGSGAAESDGHEPREQKVTWAELFFDVVWVFAVTQLAGALAHAHGPGGVAKSLLLVVPLWWCWFGATVLGNTAGDAVDGMRSRAVLFTLAGCGLAMSAGIPRAYADGHGAALLFAVAYCALRLVLWAEMRTRPALAGVRWNPFGVVVVLCGPLYLAGAAVDGPARVTAWACAAALEVGTWLVLSEKLARIRFETAHLPERFGLFLIIALGESIMAVGTQASEQPIVGSRLAAMGVGFVLIVLLWWTYFHFGASAARHGLETHPKQARIVREVFTYCHGAYVVSIVLVAVGLKKVMAHPLDAPEGAPALLLAPGVALFLLTFCYSRWRMFGAAGVIRFVGGLAGVGLACAAPVLPGLAIAGAAVAVLAAVNATEWWRVSGGHQIWLLRVPGFLRRA